MLPFSSNQSQILSLVSCKSSCNFASVGDRETKSVFSKGVTGKQIFCCLFCSLLCCCTVPPVVQTEEGERARGCFASRVQNVIPSLEPEAAVGLRFAFTRFYRQKWASPVGHRVRLLAPTDGQESPPRHHSRSRICQPVRRSGCFCSSVSIQRPRL